MISSDSKGGTTCAPFAVPSCIHALESFDSLPSTNDYLLELASRITPSHPYYQRNIVCIAEQQTAGKGRRGRTWVSPTNNIYLSLLWHFPLHSSKLAGLSLAVACAVANTVHALRDLPQHSSIPSVLGLKWPNDVLWEHQKLSGILIELTPAATTSTSTFQTGAVIGIGLNLQQHTSDHNPITQPWTDLSTILQYMPDKHHVTSLLLHELTDALTLFQTEGFTPFIKQWNTWDCTLGKRVNIITPTSTLQGIGRGIDPQGLFLLEIDTGEIITFSSGDISLRLHETGSNIHA